MVVEGRTAEQLPPLARSVWEMLERALSPAEQRPRLAPGVEATHHATRAGTPYVMVCNPAAGSYLRLDPLEFELFPLMDGTRTVKELVVECYRRHGVFALSRIPALVRLLQEHRFLAEPAPDAYAALQARLRPPSCGWLLRLARGFLWSEISWRGAEPVLGSWYRAWGRLFFTRPAMLVGTVLGLLGPVIFLLELSRGRYDPFRIGGSYTLGFLLLAALGEAALLLHELGHGLAVKHSRRQVRRAGLMLYYGLPAAFVDTTDVWMAPRHMRLLVSFAGPWTGLALGGITALAAFLLPEGPTGAVLFAWGLAFLANNLLNFNPLLELDGYYLLMDLIEKPMLRARSLGFVQGPLWAKLWRHERFSGEERFFALFGLASAGYTMFALFLALRIWELRLGGVLREVWESGNPLAQGVMLLLGAVAAGAVAMMLWGLAMRVVRCAARRTRWLSGRAAPFHYRRALAALRAVPLWAELPEARLLEMAQAMRAEKVAAGTEVVRQGTPGKRFYVVGRGAFEVLVDGRPVARLHRGDYFGERALLNNAPRAATVVALEPGLVFSLDRADFHATLAHDLATKARLETALAYRVQVAEMRLFQDLTTAELDLLLARLSPVSVKEGGEVIRQGEPGDRFYLVRSGAVEVVRDGELLAVMGPGEVFGEIALLLDVPRTATVRAAVGTELLALSAVDFRDLLVAYCGRASELQRLSSSRLVTQRGRLGR